MMREDDQVRDNGTEAERGLSRDQNDQRSKGFAR